MASQNKVGSLAQTLNALAEPIPAYRRDVFKIIILGLLIGKCRKSIAGIYRVFSAALNMIVSRKRFYCFMTSTKIPWAALWAKALALIGDRLLVDGRLILLVDDTTYGKTGRKIHGCDVHFDHAAKLNSSKYLHGHCRVVVSVLTFVHGRWASLPFRQGLYRLAKSVAPEAFATKIELAGRFIADLVVQTRRPTLIVCDSWFGNKSLADHDRLKDGFKAGTVHVLSRLRINSALHGFPEPKKPGMRGRAAKYGKKLAGVRELAAGLERKTDRFFIYGKMRECSYAETTCMSKSFKRAIKIVFVFRGNTVFPIFTTDLTLTARQMVEYYAARWKIESGFKELKHELGALDTQARKEEAVENHFNLCCLAMTTAWIYAMDSQQAPSRKHPRPGTAGFAFSDLRDAIRNETIAPLNFKGVCSKAVKAAQKLVIESIFRRVA